MLATAPVFQSLGLETFTVNYRGGAQGINDVENLYLQARRQVGSAVPVCAAGVSAGGHIALMLAVRFHDLACVLDLAGPTDLSLLKRGSTVASQIVERAFGTASLAQLSPALQAHSIRAKLLLLYAQSDRLVPVDQGYAIQRADPNAQLIVLPPGSAAFVHTGILGPVQDTGVDPGAYAKAQKTEASFLDHATATG
jgi:dienelactone hydrolase